MLAVVGAIAIALRDGGREMDRQREVQKEKYKNVGVRGEQERTAKKQEEK